MRSNQCGMRSAECGMAAPGSMSVASRPMRRGRDRFRIPHSSHLIHFSLIHLKPPLLVIWQRGRMIERAGMQPHARGCEGPGVAHGAGEEMLAEALADGVRDEPEVGDLDGAVLGHPA